MVRGAVVTQNKPVGYCPNNAYPCVPMLKPALATFKASPISPYRKSDFPENIEKFKDWLPVPGRLPWKRRSPGLGVPKKQTDRCRNKGFSDPLKSGCAHANKDRLYTPGGVSLDQRSPIFWEGGTHGTYADGTAIGNEMSPMILTLLKSMPCSGSEWSRDVTRAVDDDPNRTLDLLYKDKPQ